MAEIALRNTERRAKHKVTRPEIKVIAWSEKVDRVVSAHPNREVGGAVPPEEATERPQAPTSFLTVPLYVSTTSPTAPPTTH